ncbi:MAG: hypothetical protein ACRDYX_13875 [Egibacteraceae bacterium]
MKLRVDTSELTFLLVTGPVPVRDYETQQVKLEDGVPLFSVRLVAMGSGEAEIINVKVPGEPVGLVPSQPVVLRELTAQPWSIGDKSGVAFRAIGVEAVTASAATAPRPGDRHGVGARSRLDRHRRRHHRVCRRGLPGDASRAPVRPRRPGMLVLCVRCVGTQAATAPGPGRRPVRLQRPPARAA